MPTLSVAVAETASVPVTKAPFAGAVRETCGAVLSTETLTTVEVFVLPARSIATAKSVWAPLVVEVLSQLMPYGA